MACWDRIAVDKGEAASGLRCGGGWFAVQAVRMAAHLGDFPLRLSGQLCRQRRCSSDLLRHSARPLLASPLLPRESPSFTCSIHPGLSVVVQDHQSDREGFGTSDSAGVDEDDLACRDVAKTEAFVDEPRSRGNPGDWLRALRLPASKHPDRHIRLRVELPLLAQQERDHSTDLAQVAGPLHDSPFLFLQVAWRCEPPASKLGVTWSKSCSRPSPSFVASFPLVSFIPSLHAPLGRDDVSCERRRTRKQPHGTHHVLTVPPPSCRSRRWTASSWEQVCGRTPHTHCCHLTERLLRCLPLPG